MTAVLEDVKSLDIENWLTLATAPSPTKLQLGQSPDCKNVWVDEKPGSVVTCKGFILAGTLPSNNPCVFMINYFRTASGTQTFVLSDGATVWTTVDLQNFTSIITGLASTFQLRGAVVRDKLWLTNGSDSVRTYDGTTVTVLDGTAGTPNVPKGKFIAYYDERVWMFGQTATRSKAFFSELTDTTGTIINPDNSAAWPSTSNIQVSEGDADIGTGMILYRGNLYFFKQYSIWRLVGYDVYTYSRVKTRAQTGTRFNESIQVLDNLVHFIGFDGIYVFDGEETSRISEIIHPTFDSLQQPNANNKFWQITATADFNTGTVARNLTIANKATLAAADDVASDFAAGATLTNIDTTAVPGAIQLSVTSTGKSSTNIASGKEVTASSGALTYGALSYFTDGNLTGDVGIASGTVGLSMLNSDPRNLTTIVLRGVSCGAASSITFENTPGIFLTPVSVTGGAAGTFISGNKIVFAASTLSDYTITFAAFTTTQLIWSMVAVSAGFTMRELELYTTTYNTTGKFVSRALDLGATPSSGTLSFTCLEADNGGTTPTFFTQTSADNISWDAETNLSGTASGTIQSTYRRYIRWGCNFTSSGTVSPTVYAAYLPSIYISAVHDTGGSLTAWGAFEAERDTAGQGINFYYRTGTTSANCQAASWNLIVPGAVLNDSIANQFVQFKFEIVGGGSTSLPNVTSVTINWSIGGTTVTQNVASTVWLNRYWLSAAGVAAIANSVILIRGKKQFGNPWQYRDWPILSFARFQDVLYGGDSTSGKIYQLDSGYSKAGAAMDSYFQTGDIIFGGFTVSVLEAIVEVERTGSFNLSVGYSIDRGTTWTDKTIPLTVSTFAPSFIKKLNINASSDRIRFRVRTNGIDTPFQVHRLIVYYKIEAARGSIN